MDEIVRGEMGDEEPACEKILRSLAYISNVSNQVLTFHYVDCPEGQHIAINVFDKTDIGMDGNSGTMPQNIYKSGGDELERDLKESFKDSELEKEGFLSTEKTKKDRANNEHKDKRGKVQIVTKTQQVPYPSDNKVSYDKDKMSIDVEGDISERSKVGKQQKKHEYLQLFKVNQQR
ncbi:hypothetical protein DPMN_150296 [Dreissena polymorpha]|uniref:Uncharacterized protein n=1 Tax=Dreissena polymorpha TaxID=45954 RepID=A0A9D4FF64_DREPO|nr:hypothetical protein DPMN_150296 [Dreissena polymorpha]